MLLYLVNGGCEVVVHVCSQLYVWRGQVGACCKYIHSYLECKQLVLLWWMAGIFPGEPPLIGSLGQSMYTQTVLETVTHAPFSMVLQLCRNPENLLGSKIFGGWFWKIVAERMLLNPVYMKDVTFLSVYKVEPDCSTSSWSPADFLETGQSDLPPVEWNGQVVSGGGTLYYCPGTIKCKFKCVAVSLFSPSLYINGQCYSVTKVSMAIPEATVITNHPDYTLVFSCASVVQFRCVNDENMYSPGYTVELNSGVYFCMHMYAHNIIHSYVCAHICLSCLQWIGTQV